MSLLDDKMEPFVMMGKQSGLDGNGGIVREWADGEEFKAAAVPNKSTTVRVGTVQSVTGSYTITTSRAVNLQPFDVCKRVRDGKVFLVKSDGDDNATPSTATLDMRQVTAEEWKPQKSEE